MNGWHSVLISPEAPTVLALVECKNSSLVGCVCFVFFTVWPKSEAQRNLHQYKNA